MSRTIKEARKKTCPKCKKVFITDKPRRFCSPKCSQSRKWTPEQNHARSIAKRKALMADTDAAEEERERVRKNKRHPPPVVHPDDPRLQPNQFVAGDELWVEVENWESIVSF